MQMSKSRLLFRVGVGCRFPSALTISAQLRWRLAGWLGNNKALIKAQLSPSLFISFVITSIQVIGYNSIVSSNTRFHVLFNLYISNKTKCCSPKDWFKGWLQSLGWMLRFKVPDWVELQWRGSKVEVQSLGLMLRFKVQVWSPWLNWYISDNSAEGSEGGAHWALQHREVILKW